MVAWLKFFFLSFFSNKISKEAMTRSIANVILDFILAFVIICCGLISGYVASFSRHYENSLEFRDFMYSALSGDSGIALTITDGALTAVIPNGAEYIDGIKNFDSLYNKNSYSLIVDMREIGDNDKKPDYSEYGYSADSHNYLILLGDNCMCSFTSSNGVEVRFVGDYSKCRNGEISSSVMRENEIRENLDEFIFNVFEQSIGTEFIVYVISMLRVAMLYLAAVMVLALIVFMAVKLSKSELCGTYTEAVKIVCSYMLVSSIIAFFAILIMSMFISRSLVYNLGGVIFIAVLLIRTAIIVIPTIISDRRKMRLDNGEVEK